MRTHLGITFFAGLLLACGGNNTPSNVESEGFNGNASYPGNRNL